MTRSFFAGVLVGLSVWTLMSLALCGVWVLWCEGRTLCSVLRRRWLRWVHRGSNSDARRVARRDWVEALTHDGPQRIGVRRVPPSVGKEPR